DRLSPRAQAHADSVIGARLVDLPRTYGILGPTLEQAGGGRSGRLPLPAVLLGQGTDGSGPAVLPDGRPELAVAIPGPQTAWGILLIAGESPESLGEDDVEIARVAAEAIGAIVGGAQRA